MSLQPPMTQSREMTRADRVMIILVALMVPLATIVTFDHGQAPTLRVWRFYAFPAMAIEFMTVCYASSCAGSPVRLLLQLRRPALFAVLALLLIWMAGSFTAVAWVALAQGRSAIYVLHLFFGLSLWWLLRNRWSSHPKVIFDALAYGTMAYVVMVALFVATAPWSSDAFDWRLFGLAGGNIRATGYLLALGSVFLFFHVGRWRRRARLFGMAIATAGLALLLWSGSRGGGYSVVITILSSFFIIGGSNYRKVLLRAVPVLGAAAILSVSMPVPDHNFGSLRILNQHASAQERPTSGRTEIWEATVQHLKNVPRLGYGSGQFALFDHDLDRRVEHPHNVVLHAVFQWGWIGGLIFIGLLLAFLIRSVTIARKVPLAAASAMTSICAALISLMGGPLHHPLVAMVIVTHLALANGMRRA